MTFATGAVRGGAGTYAVQEEEGLFVIASLSTAVLVSLRSGIRRAKTIFAFWCSTGTHGLTIKSKRISAFAIR